MSEHVCDPTSPVCPCGYRWEFKREWSDGSTTYTSAGVVAKYRALYGEPEIPFAPMRTYEPVRRD